jgi:hypothetical protein
MTDIYVFSLHNIQGIESGRIFYRKITPGVAVPNGIIVLAVHEGDFYSNVLLDFVSMHNARVTWRIYLTLSDNTPLPRGNKPEDILERSNKNVKAFYGRLPEICMIDFPFPDYQRAQTEITNQL